MDRGPRFAVCGQYFCRGLFGTNNNNHPHTQPQSPLKKKLSVTCVCVCVCAYSVYKQNQCVEGFRSKVFSPMSAVRLWSEVCARRVRYDKRVMQSVVLGRTSQVLGRRSLVVYGLRQFILRTQFEKRYQHSVPPTTLHHKIIIPHAGHVRLLCLSGCLLCAVRLCAVSSDRRLL